MDELWLHARLSRFLGASFGAKVMFVAAVVALIPLLAVTVFVLVHPGPGNAFALQLLGVVLCVTLASLAISLLVLSHLLRPVRLIACALRAYIRERRLPALPNSSAGEIGTLIADVSHVVLQLDAAISALPQYDPGTGLPNREHLLRLLGERMGAGGPFVLCAVTEHNHDRVSAVLGPQAADAVMRTLAQTLLAAAGHRAGVASVGPNQLAFVLTGDAAAAAAILAALPSEVAVDGAICLCQLAAGTARFPGGGDAPERLLSAALAAVPPVGAMDRIAVDGDVSEVLLRPAPA